MKRPSQASLWIAATSFPAWSVSSSTTAAALIFEGTSTSSTSCVCHHRRRRVSSGCSNSSSASSNNYCLAGGWRSRSISTSASAAISPSLLSLFVPASSPSSSSSSTCAGISIRKTSNYSIRSSIPLAKATVQQQLSTSMMTGSSTTSITYSASNYDNNYNNHHPQVKNRVALLQLPVTRNKEHNLQSAIEYIRQAQNAGARLCVLPEIWNSPYATAAFPEYAEILPQVGDGLSGLPSNAASFSAAVGHDGGDNDHSWGKSSLMLMEMAKSTNMYIVGGSIPEVVVTQTNEGTKTDYYNTCLIINPHGTVVAKHRKVHLFDVNVPGGIQFKESETLTKGDLGATYFDVVEEEEEEEERGKVEMKMGCDLGRIGVGICYDIRFPEYALILTQIHQCKILIYPGAFNLTTGPAHWELLQRARAVDGQCYVLTASPARMPLPSSTTTAVEENADNSNNEIDTSSKQYPHYSAWGHSSIISPWGEVIATCDENPAVVIADLDMDKVEEMRMSIPTMIQKRHDLYRLVEGRSAPNDHSGST